MSKQVKPIGIKIARPVQYVGAMASAFIDAAAKTGITASAPWTARRVAVNCDRERAGVVTDECRANLKFKTRIELEL